MSGWKLVGAGGVDERNHLPFCKGKGWVAGYKDQQPTDIKDMQRILRELATQNRERVLHIPITVGRDVVIRQVTITGTVEI